MSARGFQRGDGGFHRVVELVVVVERRWRSPGAAGRTAVCRAFLRGVQITTSVLSRYCAARASSAAFQPGGGSGHGCRGGTGRCWGPGRSTRPRAARTPRPAAGSSPSCPTPIPRRSRCACAAPADRRHRQRRAGGVHSERHVAGADSSTGDVGRHGGLGVLRRRCAATGSGTGGGGSPARSPSASRKTAIPCAGRRGAAAIPADRDRCRRSGRAARHGAQVVLGRAATVRPPAASNSATRAGRLRAAGPPACCAAGTACRRSGSVLNPVASQAFRSGSARRRRCRAAMARNAQCRSSSVAASRLCRNRPCSTTCLAGRRVEPERLLGVAALGDPRVERRREQAGHRGVLALGVQRRRRRPPAAVFGEPAVELVGVAACTSRRAVAADAGRLSRQSRCASSSTTSRSQAARGRARRPACSSRRGVYWGASSNADGRIGQLG